MEDAIRPTAEEWAQTVAFLTLSQAPGAPARLAPGPRFPAFSVEGQALLEATADSSRPGE